MDKDNILLIVLSISPHFSRFSVVHPPVLRNAFRGIDIGVAKHIRNQINISGFPVQIGAVGAAKLMRRDFL